MFLLTQDLMLHYIVGSKSRWNWFYFLYSNPLVACILEKLNGRLFELLSLILEIGREIRITGLLLVFVMSN